MTREQRDSSNTSRNGNGKPNEGELPLEEVLELIKQSPGGVFGSIRTTLELSHLCKPDQDHYYRCLKKPQEHWNNDERRFMSEILHRIYRSDPPSTIVLNGDAKANGNSFLRKMQDLLPVQVIPMKPEHIRGDEGVEACYRSSEIPYGLLASLGEPFFEQRVEASVLKRKANGGMKGGMLHSFHQRPVDAQGKECESVCEYLERRIRESRQILEVGLPRKADDGKWRALYEGFVLVPEGKTTPVLAWASGTRSIREKDSFKNGETLPPYMWSRSPDNDTAVAEVHAQLDAIECPGWENKKAFQENAGDVYLFDTLSGCVPGAAGRLFHAILSYIDSYAYSHMLLYRHKMLQLVGNVEKPCLPQGNNDASEAFFRDRGFREIGTTLSPLTAIRAEKAGDRMVQLRIRTIEGWMMGEVERAMEISKAKYGPPPKMAGFPKGKKFVSESRSRKERSDDTGIFTIPSGKDPTVAQPQPQSPKAGH